jgi:hypothetical protein
MLLGEEGDVGVVHGSESTTIKAGERVKGHQDVVLDNALEGNKKESGETI